MTLAACRKRKNLGRWWSSVVWRQPPITMYSFISPDGHCGIVTRGQAEHCHPRHCAAPSHPAHTRHVKDIWNGKYNKLRHSHCFTFAETLQISKASDLNSCLATEHIKNVFCLQAPVHILPSAKKLKKVCFSPFSF